MKLSRNTENRGDNMENNRTLWKSTIHKEIRGITRNLVRIAELAKQYETRWD